MLIRDKICGARSNGIPFKLTRKCLDGGPVVGSRNLVLLTAASARWRQQPGVAPLPRAVLRRRGGARLGVGDGDVAVRGSRRVRRALRRDDNAPPQGPRPVPRAAEPAARVGRGGGRDRGGARPDAHRAPTALHVRLRGAGAGGAARRAPDARPQAETEGGGRRGGGGRGAVARRQEGEGGGGGGGGDDGVRGVLRGTARRAGGGAPCRQRAEARPAAGGVVARDGRRREGGVHGRHADEAPRRWVGRGGERGRGAGQLSCSSSMWLHL